MNLDKYIIAKELDKNVVCLEVYCEKAKCISEELIQGYYSLPKAEPERILEAFDRARIENAIVDDYLSQIANQIAELKQKLLLNKDNGADGGYQNESH